MLHVLGRKRRVSVLCSTTKSLILSFSFLKLPGTNNVTSRFLHLLAAFLQTYFSSYTDLFFIQLPRKSLWKQTFYSCTRARFRAAFSITYRVLLKGESWGCHGRRCYHLLSSDFVPRTISLSNRYVVSHLIVTTTLWA